MINGWLYKYQTLCVIFFIFLILPYKVLFIVQEYDHVNFSQRGQSLG